MNARDAAAELVGMLEHAGFFPGDDERAPDWLWARFSGGIEHPDGFLAAKISLEDETVSLVALSEGGIVFDSVTFGLTDGAISVGQRAAFEATVVAWAGVRFAA